MFRMTVCVSLSLTVFLVRAAIRQQRNTCPTLKIATTFDRDV